jgi:hypothetical protein
MKTRIAIKVILALAVIFCLTACATEEIPSTSQTESRTDVIVEPVYGENGFIERLQSKSVAKFQWLTSYDFPSYQPHYCTIYQNGVVKLDNVTGTIVAINLTKRTKQATFTITQTVISIGTSAPVVVTVYDPTANNKKK